MPVSRTRGRPEPPQSRTSSFTFLSTVMNCTLCAAGSVCHESPAIPPSSIASVPINIFSLICDHQEDSASGVVLALGVTRELRAVEVDLAEVAGAVADGLVVKVRRRRMAALSAGRDGPGAHAIAELDYGHEAVSAGAVPFLRTRIGARSERRERSPSGGGEGNGDAQTSVVERLPM